MIQSQAVALPDRSEAAISAKLHSMYLAIAEAETSDDATVLADHARILAAAVRASNQSLEVQNEAARLRLTAERRLGELLAEHHGDKLPEGVNWNRSARAQKLARITDTDWRQWMEVTLEQGKELTHAGAMRIVPAKPREERKGLADAYAVPAIDIELAREWGLEASDWRAELIVRSIQQGLREVQAKNPRHAFVWSRYHGINDDGTLGESWTYEGIATQCGWTRPYVEGLYFRASHHIRGVIAVNAMLALSETMAAA